MKIRKSSIISILFLLLAFELMNGDYALTKQIRLKIFDTFQKLTPRKFSPQPVRIIDIDNESLRRIGQWPWPRSTMAKIVDRLNDNGVAAIAMDIVFAEGDRTSPKNVISLWGKEKELSYLKDEIRDHDELFAEAISRANVATGFTLNDTISGKFAIPKAGYSYNGDYDPKMFLPRFRGYETNLKMFEEAATGNGAFNSSDDEDHILRKIPMAFVTASTIVPSLSAEALRIAQGAPSYLIKTTGAQTDTYFGGTKGLSGVKIGHFEVPTDLYGYFWLYFTNESNPKERKKAKEWRYIPAWKILDEKEDISFLEGNIVFVGTSAEGLRDIRATPLNPRTNGVELHVQALEQILTGNFIVRPDWLSGVELTFMVLVGLILIFTIPRISPVLGALFTFTSVGGAAAFSWQAFGTNIGNFYEGMQNEGETYNLLFDPVIPIIAVMLVYLSESISRYITSENEKKQVRNAFSHYMSPALVNKLAENPDSLQLGGETKELTLLFCDIRGFTTISEQFDAHSLTNFINKFLTPMTTIILDKQGTIDKYMGDCIMAFWNAPLDDNDHARNGCISALMMLDALVELNKQQEVEATEAGRKFIPINIGIGLNTGDCCVGNMGSDQRFDYSVLGDDVNLASRLEGQSKTYGVSIVIGENTKNNVGDMATLELDLIQVKGKTEPVRIFTLLGQEELKNSDKFNKLKTEFNKMLKEYRSQNWQKAQTLLKSCKTKESKIEEFNIEGLFELYDNRIKEFLKSPPPKDWDGVFIATSK